MNQNLCTFECLPNEILIEIFKNLNVQDLFRAFYNLNSRLNILLHSVDHCQTIFIPDSNQSIDDEIFYPYIHTLIIQNGIDIIFDHLRNVRRVIIYYYSGYPMKGLEINIPSNIIYLTILSTNQWLLSFPTDFIQKIFSNHFPYLKSCYLPDNTAILSNEKWTQSPSLRIFKTGFITSNIYKLILSSCPNLYSFKFSTWAVNPSTFSMESHMNLKQLKIDLSKNDFLNSTRLNNYFLSVPNLEQLTIQIILRDSQSIISIQDCDWFSSIIDCYLPKLRQFYCYVIFAASTNIDEDDHGNILNQMKDKFEQLHKNRYQSKILFKFSDC